MPDKLYADYFLGANTPAGFRSLFEQSYCAAEGWQVYIIKGGPGTGKSTLMRSVAHRAAELGIFSERIHCSSDPHSLDAVIIPSLRRAIYDGTAPHVLEPSLPGCCEQLVDLGRAWDSDRLFERREEIALYSSQCSACHRQASRMLACAEVFRARLLEPAQQAADRQKIARTADRLCERFGLSRRSSEPGPLTCRLASAVTPEGILTVSEDYLASFGRIVPVLDRSYAVSGLLLGELRDRLLARGYSVIECPCSQNLDRPEHLLVPGEDICFTTRSDAHGGELHTASDTRAVRAERFLPEALTRGRHPQQNADRRELMRFTQLAADCMRRAKSIHDRLEECYKDTMDFGILDQIGRETVQRMLG